MLFKKMLRDMKRNKSQFITIFLMVFIGVGAYSGIESYIDGMTKTGEVFYSENNLQDLNVMGVNFTEEDLNKIKNMEHVKNAERKLSVIANQVSNDDKTLLLNIIESNDISKFHIVAGEEFKYEKSGVWIDEFYANKNKLKINDSIEIKYNNYIFTEQIVGLINVPDHLYDVKDESEVFPNHETYGFVYISANELCRFINNFAINNMRNN